MKNLPSPLHNNKRSEKGSALVFALLIVAMSSIIAYALIQTSSFAVRRTGQLISNDACLQAVYAAELVAEQLLMQESKTDAEPATRLDQAWAEPWEMQLNKDMHVLATLSDLQGQFNVNLLATDSSSATGIYSPALVFTRLLVLLDIHSPQALQRSLSHWINAPKSEQDAVYLASAFPYQAAHAPLASISELALIQGFSAPILLKLAPMVSALPEGVNMNVNTAPPVLLAALLDAPLDAIEAFAEERKTMPFNTPEEFTSRAKARGINIKDEETLQGLISVNSSYFLLQTEASCQKSEMLSYSFVKRSSEGEAMVYRYSKQK